MSDTQTHDKRMAKDREVFHSWTSPSRLFKRRDKEYFTNIGAIVFLLTVILVFAREFLLIAAVVSIVFLIYVLSTVPPEDVNHHLSSHGIETAGHYYRWDELREFWFEEQWGQNMLILVHQMGTRVIILLGNEKRETIKTLVEKYIPFREAPEKSWVDNAAQWLSDKVPLEKPTS